MDVKESSETAALAAKLRLKLDPTGQEDRVCKETVDAASGDPSDAPLARTPQRGRLIERAEHLQARLGLSHLNRWVLAGVALAVAVTGLFVTVLSWPSAENTATAAAVPIESAPVRPETIVVSVAGAVKEPGIVELEAGSRVADAIEAAGGLVDNADPGYLNLARVVADGDLVAVPDATAEQGTVDEPGGGGAVPGDLVNINAADEQTLTTLTGIGPVLAERIVAYREANGSFQSIDELAEVQGVGPKMLEQIRDQVTL